MICIVRVVRRTVQVVRNASFLKNPLKSRNFRKLLAICHNL
jgi:hypothetical protein